MTHLTALEQQREDQALGAAFRRAVEACKSASPHRYLVLDGPIASGVYWAHGVLFDGNKAHWERMERKEPAGFGSVEGGATQALEALADALEARQRQEDLASPDGVAYSEWESNQ